MQIRAGQWSITANLRSLTTHIYYKIITVTSSFYKSFIINIINIIIIIIIIITIIIIRFRALLLVAPVYSVRADNTLLSKVSQSFAQ